MKTVSYKGYQASVEFEDDTLFVKVLHIADLLVAECDRASEVEATAKTLIDDYLETCAELGRNPEPPFKGSFNVRMSPEQHRKVAMAAAEDGVSLNGWVCSAVTEKLDCNRLSDRFDGVISKKDHEVRLRTLQMMKREVVFVHSVAPARHHQDMPVVAEYGMNRTWGKLNG